jgi:hypothetical protein
MADSKHRDEAMVELLLPCRECGAPCRVETFGGGVHVIPTVVWVCSNNEIFGGRCPSTQSYLTEEAWNTRPAVSSLGDDEMVRLKKALAEAADDLGFAAKLFEEKRDYIASGTARSAEERARAAIAAMTG